MAAPEWHNRTALDLGQEIEKGTVDPRDLTRYFYERIAADPQGDKVYMHLTRARAEAEAEAAAARASSGTRLSPLDGVPISWKDLFDSSGDFTEGGSQLLRGRIPEKDATALARATKAGLICLGKTSMTEFAFSGLGYNPTCGSPTNPFDDRVARLPGGSSGGAGVSVASGLAAAGIGSDTGGSVRLPAAWNGLVGLKTTFGAIPLDGVLPLSPTLDTIGPLTRDVADAAALFAIMADRPLFDLQKPDLKSLNLALAKNEILWSSVDEDCWPVIDAALERLTNKEAILPSYEIGEIDPLLGLFARNTGSVAWEAYEAWGELIEERPELVYSEVAHRILAGKQGSKEEFEEIWAHLRDIRRSYLSNTLEIDALIMPTVGFVPPEIDHINESPENYRQTNGATLFNTSIANQFGLCAITLPIGKTSRTGRHGELPVGLMLMAGPGREERLLNISLLLEEIFAELNE